MTSCCLVGRYQRFGGTDCLLLQITSHFCPQNGGSVVSGNIVSEEHTSASVRVDVNSWKWRKYISSEALVPTYQGTRFHNPEDHNMHLHHHRNTKPCANVKVSSAWSSSASKSATLDPLSSPVRQIDPFSVTSGVQLSLFLWLCSPLTVLECHQLPFFRHDESS
jgi:hypothetical protein